MSPHDATRCLTRNDRRPSADRRHRGPHRDDAVRGLPAGYRDDRAGRAAEHTRPAVLDYLEMFETCFNTFPGFEVEIQGVYREVDSSGRVRLHTYVVAQ